MGQELGRLTTAVADRFRVEREIGTGGMAVVFLAEDLRHRRKVAIKVLQPELAAIIGAERFEREIEIVARLHHPHILPLHDSGSAAGLLYYVMPFVEGGSLRDRLVRERQLSIEDALQISREVADALAHAHSQGVVHRDIKPENIMLDAGHAVVSDFGIALLSQSVTQERLTETGLSPGTPEYMSPEQASGDRRVDGRSDIYSLGCVLYEMLGGDPPFTGSTGRAVIARKLVDAVPSVRVVRESVPESLERVALKALGRVPADRHRTAGEFRDALDAVAVEIAPARHSDDMVAQRRWHALARSTALAVGSLVGTWLLLTMVGFLTTAVFDEKLQVPASLRPTTEAFTLVGGRALLPFVVYCVIFAVVFVAAKYLLRGLAYAMRSLPSLHRTVDALRSQFVARWKRFWDARDASTAVELFLVGAVGLSVLVIASQWGLLRTLWTSESEILACASRPIHRDFSFVLSFLIAGLAFGWYRLGGYVKHRKEQTKGVAVAQVASMGWIVFLLMVLTMPWRLVWDESYERRMIGGERAYPIVETQTELVVYLADTGATRRFNTSEIPNMQRVEGQGYLFEENEAFGSGQRGCSVIVGGVT